MKAVFEPVDRSLAPIKPWKTLSGRWLNEMRQPMVYVWTRGDQVLYVGLAKSGLARPIDSNHHRLHRGVIRPTDEVSLYLCQTAQEAIVLEKQLIACLGPSLNGQRKAPRERDRWLNRIVEDAVSAVRGEA